MMRLSTAAAVVRRGGVIAYPTEGCFGLGCDPRKPKAVARILSMKRRRWQKGLILIAADIDQLKPYVTAVPANAGAAWPGPRTFLLHARQKVPCWIRGRHPRIAVRVSAKREVIALCRSTGGALVSTSANRAGERPARSYREALERFGRKVDYVLPGRIGPLRGPTPIIDAVSGHVLRGNA